MKKAWNDTGDMSCHNGAIQRENMPQQRRQVDSSHSPWSRGKQNWRRMFSPEILIDDQSPDHIHIVIPRTTWRGNVAQRVKMHIGRVVSASLGGWIIPLGLGIVKGMFTWDELVWLIVAALVLTAIAVTSYGVWLVCTIGEVEDIVLDLSAQEISLSRYFVHPWCRLPWMRDRHAPLRSSCVMMKTPYKEFGLIAVGENVLSLLFSGARCEIAREWSLNDRERLYTLFRQYLPPVYDYALVTKVILGDRKDGAQEETSYTTLYNPKVSDLTQRMRALRQIVVYPHQCDPHYIEQFITYVVNYVGQKILKKHVTVYVHGHEDSVHINIHNSLVNLCKQVRYTYKNS